MDEKVAESDSVWIFLLRTEDDHRANEDDFSKPKDDIALQAHAYHSFDHTIEMLNKTMGTCIS